MAERNYFAEPKDVTIEYKKRVKSLPRTFVVVTFVWVTISLFTVVFGAVWQLVCALVLVTIILFFGNKMAGDRVKISNALKRGTIMRRIRMDDDSLETVDESLSDASLILDKTRVTLIGLVDVRVARNWIGIYGIDPEFCSLELRNDDFRDTVARRAFIDELLGHVEAAGSTDEHREPFNPWIGKL
jgi:hypothetical protein